jgi:hypothetical protein
MGGHVRADFRDDRSDLVSWNPGIADQRIDAAKGIQIGSAEPDGLDLQEHLIGTVFRLIYLAKTGLAGCIDIKGLHSDILFECCSAPESSSLAFRRTMSKSRLLWKFFLSRFLVASSRLYTSRKDTFPTAKKQSFQGRDGRAALPAIP